MRAFASGLGAPSDPTPTRILHLSPKAVELLDAYKGDPAWSDDALKSTTEGSIASLALVRWAREIEKVFREQQYVYDVLRCVSRRRWVALFNKLCTPSYTALYL